MKSLEELRPLARLIEIMRLLRSAEGCPWDREQDLQSLKPCLLEECHELIEAIDSGDVDHHREELGDVLLQVVFQAQIRDESGAFDIHDVAETLCDKLIRRHPHVFGDSRAHNSEDVIRQWESIKRTEDGRQNHDGKMHSVLDGLPRSLPALHKAHLAQKKAARVGFDWNDVAPVIEKVEEELGEIRSAIKRGDAGDIREEIGDLLFSVVNLCRFFNENAEMILHRTVEKFARRFRFIETEVHKRGDNITSYSLEELDLLWEQAKKAEKKAAPAIESEGADK